MNKNTTSIIVGASALIALVSLVSATSLSSKNKTAKAEILALQEQIVRMEASVPDAASEPEIVYLTSNGDTNEVTALKTQLAEKDAQLENVQSRTNRPPRQRESWEDRIAKMKEEDPEGYAEMVQRRQERQEEMRYDLAERTATFLDLDTSNMTEEERANHDLLVEKMARVWELSDAFQDPEATPDRDTMREMFTTINETRPLMDQERSVMFKQLASEIGYTGDDSAAFAEHIEKIIDATTVQMPRGGGRGGRGR